MDKVKIAILGFGNVGTGVWKILNTNNEEITRRCGYEIQVSKILVNDVYKKRDIQVPSEILTDDIEEILKDDTIKIIVEVMGGTHPAKDYILRSLKNKKHVVTANKVVISTMGDELFKVAYEEGVFLYYEASVAGGIPIIHEINESLTANKIQKVAGIINGTTNYILTKMTLLGMTFEDALKEAQLKGFAEADPTSDVDGFDAVYKLAILSSLSFGCKIDVTSIYREGITKITPVDIKYANEFGYTIKLLAIVKEVDDMLELRVHPAMIPSTHPLSNVNDSYNAIFLRGNAIGDLMLYGRGAGDLPTGSAVVGDIISILRNSQYVSSNSFKSDLVYKEIKPMEDTKCQYYIRMTVKDVPGVLGEITTLFGKNNVSMMSVIQKGDDNGFVPLVFITHETREGDVQNSAKEIQKLRSVNRIENIIRVENM